MTLDEAPLRVAAGRLAALSQRLLAHGLQQAGEVELRGGHLALDHLEARLVQRPLHVRLCVQVSARRLSPRIGPSVSAPPGESLKAQHRGLASPLPSLYGRMPYESGARRATCTESPRRCVQRFEEVTVLCGALQAQNRRCSFASSSPSFSATFVARSEMFQDGRSDSLFPAVTSGPGAWLQYTGRRSTLSRRGGVISGSAAAAGDRAHLGGAGEKLADALEHRVVGRVRREADHEAALRQGGQVLHHVVRLVLRARAAFVVSIWHRPRQVRAPALLRTARHAPLPRRPSFPPPSPTPPWHRAWLCGLGGAVAAGPGRT